MRLIIYFIFENSPAEKIVGEPDERVRSYEYIAQDIAFKAQKNQDARKMPFYIIVSEKNFMKDVGNINLFK